MKNYLILVLFITGFGLEAQNQELFQNNWSADSTSIFGFHGLANFQSQSLNSTIAGILIYGGEIDQEVKDKNLEAHKAQNRIEGNSLAQIFYQSNNYQIGKYDFSYGLHIEQDISAYATYTKDFFQLTFYGNSNLESADLSQSKLTFWDIQKFGIPLTFQFSDSIKNKITEIGIQPTYYLGRNYIQIETEDFLINTATDGSSITFNGELNAMISDTSDARYSGSGGGINFHIYQKYNDWEFRFSGRNIGAINWQNSLNATFDQSRRYNGITVEDIFDVSDSISAQGFIEDSLMTWSKTNNTKWLPASFELSARYQVLENNFLIGSIRYVNASSFLPQLEVGYTHQGESLQYGVSAGFGGMTSALLGGYFGTSIYGVDAQIYTHSLLGGVAYNTPGLATNAGLRLQYHY